MCTNVGREIIKAHQLFHKDIVISKVFNLNLKKGSQKSNYDNYADLKFNKNLPGDTCKYWLQAQEKVNFSNRIKFFKTHNVFGKVNNYDFTNVKNSIACLYVVRDPRNVITSLKNHYQLDDDQAFQWMKNEKNFIYNAIKETNYSI